MKIVNKPDTSGVITNSVISHTESRLIPGVRGNSEGCLEISVALFFFLTFKRKSED